MMNNRGHLPAGQAVQGVDMGPGPGPGGGGRGDRGGGPHRGGRHHHHPPYPAHYHQHHHQPHHQPHQPPMHHHHGSYSNAYAAAPYYPIPPAQYQNGGGALGSPSYVVYPPAAAAAAAAAAPFPRSPSSIPPYMPMVPPAYSRQPQHSPAVSTTPYHPPLPHAPIPVPPHTPSTSHSVHAVPPPMTPPTPQLRDTHQVQPPQLQPQLVHPLPQPPVSLSQTPQVVPRPMEPSESRRTTPLSQVEPPVQLAVRPKPDISATPFRPPLPWLSRPDLPFPTRTAKSKRRRRILDLGAEAVELPANPHEAAALSTAESTTTETATTETSATTPASTPKPAPVDKAEAAPRSDTPSTQEQPSEGATSTSPITPGSTVPQQPAMATSASSLAKPASRPAVPAVPVVPALPKASSSKDAKSSPVAAKPPVEGDAGAAAPSAKDDDSGSATQAAQPEAQPAPAPVKAAPKLWTGLFAKPSPGSAAAQPAGQQVNGAAAAGTSSAVAGSVARFAKPNASSQAEALRAYQIGGADKLAFLEPRGLINTGNMCYMNSVLQVLLFCVPFYDFLDQVSKKAAHSFKSDTPLVDAMIMFFREFNVIDSAASAELLRRRLKNDELEKYGEPFTPEFVYDAIRPLPRFASMRRGHQQDAEEFLGFLLEGLHDECAQVMRAASASEAATATNPSPSSTAPAVSFATDTSHADTGDDWLEVGPRQRAAVTRSSGYSNISSPVTKIFGGQLRSEFRVPGLKNSVTLEPYQPLQLDIGAPEVRNIVDALKGLTRPETIHGDFNSPHGKGVTATKQVSVESLPPVLILHLKRFQFDAEGNGTVKIWKKVGYPLELEIPRDVLSRQKQNAILAEGADLPRYRLTAVVYHHGKNASGGHYTVDVRRQEGLEWIRIDDTVISRVRSEDVAEGGAEEKTGRGNASAQDTRPKDLAGSSSNRFVGITDEDAGDGDGWKQVSGGGGTVNGGGSKKWSSVVNSGSSTRSSTPKGKPARDNKQDNKVAYLLFYQRI